MFKICRHNHLFFVLFWTFASIFKFYRGVVKQVIAMKSDRGVTVSMDAFQAFDPGSTPGDRTVYFLLETFYNLK